MTHRALLLLLLLLAPFTASSQTIEERIMRDMKQHGYFIEWRDTLETRLLTIRDREPIRDPETFLAAVFVWKSPHANAPQPKGAGWLMIMVEVADVEKGGEYEPLAYEFAIRSQVPLYCASYGGSDKLGDPTRVTINLIHRIDPELYDPQEFKLALACMREEWRKWANWR
jgi:hypothetical protein